MGTLTTSLTESLKVFVDEQVAKGGYGTRTEYICGLLRREQKRLQLRSQLLEGATSATGEPAGEAYFAAFRRRV